MITNDERREIARRLREIGKYVFCPENVYDLLTDALGVDDFDGTDELFARLADLIEPSIPADPGEAGLVSVEGFIREMRHSTKEEQDLYGGMLEKMSVELRPVDRDALVELARVCEDMSDMYAEARARLGDDALGGLFLNVAEFEWKTARIIRKALGAGR